MESSVPRIETAWMARGGLQNWSTKGRVEEVRQGRDLKDLDDSARQTPAGELIEAAAHVSTGYTGQKRCTGEHS